MQPAGAQHRPPATIEKYRFGTARTAYQQRDPVRPEHRKRRPHRDAAKPSRHDQSHRVEGHTGIENQRDQPEVAPKLAQRPPVAPQAGIAAPARVTLVVVDPDERAARGTDHGTGALALEHRQELISQYLRGSAWRTEEGLEASPAARTCRARSNCSARRAARRCLVASPAPSRNWSRQGGEDRRPDAAPRVTRRTVRILLSDWPLDNARSIQKLSYRITPFDKGINRLLAGTG